MATTLSQTLSSWRTEHQSGIGHQGLMSQLTIDGSLYDIQDPALEAMMTEIESRLNTIEGSNPAAVDVSFDNTSNGFTATNVQAAIIEAITKATAEVIGASTDAASADTINAAKKYAAGLVADLAGADWEQNAKTVKEIIAEIENSDSGNAWATAIDKLAGLGIKTEAVHYTQEECDEYNTANSLSQGDDDYKTTEDIKTPAVYNTVVDYVQSYVTTQLGTTVSDLQTLDAAAIKSVNGVSRAANDTTGAITLTGANIDLSGTDNRKLSTVVSGLETNKANKAAITTSTVNNWSSSYSNGNLTWSNSQTTVYVPASGQTL